MSFLRPLSIPTGSWVQVADTPMIIHRYVSDKVILFIPSHTHHVSCTDRDRDAPSCKPAWNMEHEPGHRVTSAVTPSRTLDTVPPGEREALIGVWVETMDHKLMILTGFSENRTGYVKCIDPAKEVTIVPMTEPFPRFDCERAWTEDGQPLKLISGLAGR